MTGCTYKALSADASTAHGKSPILAIHDELGQHRGPQSPLYDALVTGQAAHEAPLSIVISTQAATDADLLSILIDDATAGHDPHTVCIIHEAPRDCKLDDVAAWKVANPGIEAGFISLGEIKLAADKAKRMPSFEASFRNLHLNQRVAVENAFISADIWKLNSTTPDLSAFEDYPSWWGLDLSSRLDLTALVGICPTPNGIVHVDARFFAPKEGIRERADRDRTPYHLWAQQGHLTATPGRSVDYSFVAKTIGEIMQRGPVEAIAFDRWRIDELKRELSRESVDAPLVSWGQGFKDMRPALSALEAITIEGKMSHGGHPCLTSCASNAIVTLDAAGGRKLDKSKATGRIDGMVALAMACGIHARGAEVERPPPPSPFEDPTFTFAAI